MIYLKHLDVLIIMIFVTLSIGMIVRLYFGGLPAKKAVSYFLKMVLVFPLMYIYFLNDICKSRRKVLYAIRSNRNISEDQLKHLERIYKSSVTIVMYFTYIVIRYYRIAIDLYVDASVKYEAFIQTTRHVKDKNKKFFVQLRDTFDNNILYEKLFSYK